MPLSFSDTTVYLAVALAVAGVVSIVAGGRGGRFRGLPGWSGAWIVLAVVLVVLEDAPRWASFPALGLLMFGALRQYFSIAPVRPRDRYAVLAAYVAIPIVLYAAWTGSALVFLVTAIVLLGSLPVFVSLGSTRAGLLESTGRAWLGLFVYVLGLGHLALVPEAADRVLPLWGAVVIACELPLRLLGRPRTATGPARTFVGFLAACVVAIGVGAWTFPSVGFDRGVGAVAGAAVAIAVAAGGVVAEAVAEDLNLGGPATRVGRGAFLDRTMPTAFAAAVFAHVVLLVSGAS